MARRNGGLAVTDSTLPELLQQAGARPTDWTREQHGFLHTVAADRIKAMELQMQKLQQFQDAICAMAKMTGPAT